MAKDRIDSVSLMPFFPKNQLPKPRIKPKPRTNPNTGINPNKALAALQQSHSIRTRMASSKTNRRPLKQENQLMIRVRLKVILQCLDSLPRIQSQMPRPFLEIETLTLMNKTESNQETLRFHPFPTALLKLRR
jgi:hypothetical protein